MTRTGCIRTSAGGVTTRTGCVGTRRLHKDKTYMLRKDGQAQAENEQAQAAQGQHRLRRNKHRLLKDKDIRLRKDKHR
jgi:hypothetical protein